MSSLKNYLNQCGTNGYDPSIVAYLAQLQHLEEVAPFIATEIKNELRDQRTHLKLIASENFSSLSVQLAMGNLLTDKYAEGYPYHRFYAGCEHVDRIEDLARQELIELYKAEHAYVQPHSGADANLVALWSILIHRIQTPTIKRLEKKNLDSLTPEEYESIRQELVNQKLMGMSLNSGGHLTHGYRHNVSSKICRAVTYDVDRNTEQLDYASLAEAVRRERPLILLAGYSAHPRRLNFARFREIADEVGATLWVDMAHFAGLVAGGVFQGEENPIPYADIISSTTHKTLRGPRGGFVLCKKELSPEVDKGCPNVLGGPLPHMIAAKAVAFQEARTASFQSYSQLVIENARALADGFLKRDFRLVTGGTDNHLMIVDITPLGITGRQAECALREVGITVNRNAIPFDLQGPWYTSGIRLGTPALTTLGMGVKEMDLIAELICKVLRHLKPAIGENGDKSKISYHMDTHVGVEVKAAVQDLLTAFPLYPEVVL